MYKPDVILTSPPTTTTTTLGRIGCQSSFRPILKIGTNSSRLSPPWRESWGESTKSDTYSAICWQLVVCWQWSAAMGSLTASFDRGIDTQRIRGEAAMASRAGRNGSTRYIYYDDDDDGWRRRRRRHTKRQHTYTHHTTTNREGQRGHGRTGRQYPIQWRGSTCSASRLHPNRTERRGDGRAEGPMRGSRAGSFFASTDGLGGRRRWTHVVPYTTRKTLRGEQLQPSTLSSGWSDCPVFEWLDFFGCADQPPG